MAEIRDFQIAVADALRLNDCYNELREAFSTHPLVDGDDDLLRKRLKILPATTETEAWVHLVNCGEVAERYIRAGIMNRNFPLWIRTATADELVDYYAAATIENRTLTTGVYLSFKDPTPYLYGRPLWVKRSDWRAFFTQTMKERYGIAEPTRAPSHKTGRPPSDIEVLAKADEMRGRKMTARDIAKFMRLELGFENIATRDVRELIRGRYSRTGRGGMGE